MYKEELISGVKCKFKLFKQPYKVGETIKVDNTPHLILGIQRFHYNSRQKYLLVRYIVQSLVIPYEIRKVTQRPSDLYTGWFTYTIKELDKNEFESEVKPIQINDLVWFERIKATARIVEITSIEFIGTDLKVWVMVQPIYPINPNKAAELYKKEKLKGFELIKIDND